MPKETTMKFKIISLAASEKTRDWIMKIQNLGVLVDSKCGYKMNIAIDDEYFAYKVKEQEDRIKEAELKPDMFENWKKAVKGFNDNIKEIGENKVELSQLEVAEFSVVVSQVDFSKDILTLEISEEHDVIIDIIKLRHDVEAFVVNLK